MSADASESELQFAKLSETTNLSFSFLKSYD